VRVLLLSTYELGRQPFGLASPAAWLRDAGLEVACADVSRDRLDEAAAVAADVIGLYLPMHTATRLALPLIDRLKHLNPRARLCAFGLYAPLNEDALRARGVQAVFDGEFERGLTEWILDKDKGQRTKDTPPRTRDIARLTFKVPDRSGLPALHRYAALEMPDGTRRVVGYTEASRGCKHLCRHCPVVPVYEGRFRVVSPDVVMADVGAQVRAGATHITFGDPDFFNGIGHARAVAEGFAREFPAVTYDVTIKVEHLLKHREALPMLVRTGCVFVTSAVESVDGAVLDKLEKGHTRADFELAVAACRSAGLALVPTFVPFTPWTTAEGYIDLLSTIASLGLVAEVPPIQLAIRLLIPNGSRLLALEDIRRVIDPFDPEALVYPWQHPDPQVDALQREVEAIVEARANAPRPHTFARVWEAAHRAVARPMPDMPPMLARAAIPFLTEPWYC
jgi:radical SAM superfamily enzyme YgiQ (UPF0313 family)